MSTTTILFADLASWSAPIDDHDSSPDSPVATIRRIVESRDGRVGSVLDSNVLARFDSADGAVRAARSIQQAVDLDWRATRAGTPEVRIGIAVGEVRDSDDATHDATHLLARRLGAVAAPGHIVVSDLVRALLASRGDIDFDPIGTVELDDPTRPVTAWQIPWEPLPASVGGHRVIVADDAALIRSGVVQLLRAAGFEVIADVADADQLIVATDHDPPDLVVTDIRMPPTNTDDGLRAAATIRERHPRVAVLLLSQYVEADAAARLLDRGQAGIGYLLKERVSDIDEFLETCHAVIAGDTVIDPTIGARLIEARRSSKHLASLTTRERETLALMAQGRSNRAIADELFVSIRTLETYIRGIFLKLDLADTPDEHRRVRAVLEWLKDTPTRPPS